MSETDNIRVGGSRRLYNGTNQGSVLGISGGVISIILDWEMDFQARLDSHSDVIAGMGFFSNWSCVWLCRLLCPSCWSWALSLVGGSVLFMTVMYQYSQILG